MVKVVYSLELTEELNTWPILTCDLTKQLKEEKIVKHEQKGKKKK
jgi:hypothetical protein